MKITKTVHPTSRAKWRAWLKANHDRVAEIWLIYDKGAKRGLPYADAVEEALCFGWIDGIVKPIDEKQYAQRFTPRKADSNWSAVNRERFARLCAQELMMDAGHKVGPHNAKPLTQRWSEKEPLPAFVDRGIKGVARKNFDALAPSWRRMFVRWIIEGKQEETRKRRLAQAIEKLKKGEVPHM